MFLTLADKNNVIICKFITNNDIISILYILNYKGNYYFYQNGWLPKYAKFSIGIVHLSKAISYVIEMKGKTFDFLRGPVVYKFKQANDYRITLYASNSSYISDLFTIFYKKK